MPIIRRTLGDKSVKRVYSMDAVTAEATVNVPVGLAERRRFSLDDKEIIQLAAYGKV